MNNDTALRFHRSKGKSRNVVSMKSIHRYEESGSRLIFRKQEVPHLNFDVFYQDTIRLI